MMDEITSTPKRKRVVDPPLISLIAVLSMLILFLIAGTIFGSASINIPTHYDLAVSKKKEDLSVGPQVMFVQGGFQLSFSEIDAYPLGIFQSRDSSAEQFLGQLKNDIETFKSSKPKKEVEAGLTLNVVAERSTSYQALFEVLTGLKSFGFTNIQFISRFEEKD